MIQSGRKEEQVARLKSYFDGLADVLEAKARHAGVVGHAGDTGANREALIEDFVNTHCPGKLRCYRGGRILGLGRAESRQIDCVVVSDVVPRFNYHGRSHFIVEAVAMAISVKSRLDQSQLFDALENLASVPSLTPSAITQTSAVRLASYSTRLVEQTPALVVWGFDGIAGDSLLGYIKEYYATNSYISWNRRPRLIMVNKKYAIKWSTNPMADPGGHEIPAHTFHLVSIEGNPGWALGELVVQLSNAASWYNDQTVHFFMYLNEAYIGTP